MVEAHARRRVVVDGPAGDTSPGLHVRRPRQKPMTLPTLVTAIGDQIGRSSAPVKILSQVYTRWLRAAYGRHGMPWHVNGEGLRIDPKVRHLVPREGEAPLFRFLRSQIRRGDVVLDIGSFLGTYAVMAARWTGESGRVLAFEPSPETFAILRRHLRMNGLAGDRVQARCAAVGARNERRPLTTFADEPYRNMVAPSAAVASAVTVDVVTVDQICGDLGRPPDWIRMDVQGLEFDVLQGARDVLREAGARLKIVAEMHPEQWPDYGIDPREAADRLAYLGLRARALEPGSPVFRQGGHAILEPFR